MRKLHYLLILTIFASQLAFSVTDDENLPAYDSQLPEERLIIEDPTTNNLVAAKSKEAVYQIADNLYAQKVNGDYINLYEYKGRPVLLVFWASYDRYSVKSLHVLQSFQKKYGKKDLQIIAVAIDSGEQVRQFATENPHFTFTIAVGQKYLARDYGIWGLPTFYVLDKELGIRKIMSGYINKKTLEKEIKAIL